MSMMNQARLQNMGGPQMSQDTGIMPVVGGNPQTTNMQQSKPGMMVNMGPNMGPGPHNMVPASTGITSMPSSTGMVKENFFNNYT
jgi:hypothetical protein